MKLNELFKAKNIATELPETDLGSLGSRVVTDYQLDDGSRAERKDRWDKAMEMAKQTIEAKNTPYPNSSNVKYPLMTEAMIQFNARAYPAIVVGKDIVKATIYGDDEDGSKQQEADHVVEYMNWQLLQEDKGWEDDTDRLLIMLPLFGSIYRKRWFSHDKQGQTSKILTPVDFIVNANVKHLDEAPRTTEVYALYPNDIRSRILKDIFIDFTYMETDNGDDSAPQTFLEQHRWEDLDEDGYKEPYIVTVHKETSTVVRIKPRFTPDKVEVNGKGLITKITPMKYYTKYGFIPDPEGTFFDIGFADILYPINAAINTTINQVLDAGKQQNAGGGFISKSLRIGKGPISLKLNKYIPVTGSGDDIRRGIVDHDFKGPSPVLLSLMEFLINAGKEISNVKDVLTGEAQGANESPTTTLARIEQGLKVFSAIYKRIYLSLKGELDLLRELNVMYLNPETYVKVLDAKVDPEDFNGDDFDFEPVSDPTVVTDMQEMGRAQYLMQFLQDPYIDPIELRMRLLKSAHIDDPEKLIQQQEQGPSPEQQIELAQTELEKARVELLMREQDRKEFETKANVVNTKADTILKLADAESKEAGQQLDEYKVYQEALNANTERRMGGVASSSSNKSVQKPPGLEDSGAPGPMAGGDVQSLDGGGLGQGELESAIPGGDIENDIGT